MNMKIFFLAALACMGCKKETKPVDTCTISEATIAGTYLKTAVVYKSSSTAAAQDWFSGLQECEKDDLFELKTDGSVVVDAVTTCPGPPLPGGVSGWFLNADKTVLSFDAVYTIDSFDCKKIVATEKDFLVAGDGRTVTLVKQ